MTITRDTQPPVVTSAEEIQTDDHLIGTEEELGELPAHTEETMLERRATPRLRVEVECEECGSGVRSRRTTEDLSTFGLSTRHGTTYQVGTRLQLALYLQDGQQAPVQLDAEVVGGFDDHGGVRLAFRDPSVEALRRIHRFLATQTPSRQGT